MAITCPTTLDVTRLKGAIQAMYEEVAADPGRDFHFHRGLDYACELLRYDRAELESLPPASTSRFAGVGNPLRIGPIEPGETVVDLGSGAGTDLLLAARRTGPSGRAIGVDMTAAMREVAIRSAAAAGLGGVVEVRAGLLESLPLADASVDVVISNGVINLAPDKERAFREIRRVLRPGGRLYLADVVVAVELHPHEREDVELWAGCVAGALLESELIALAARVGLADGRIVERFDCYRGTPVASKVSRKLDVHAVNLRAQRPR
jgi:SAM-dependent methyltransferase